MKAIAGAFALALGMALAPEAAASEEPAARAELVEGVDVERQGNEALITIRFTVPIAYLRHAPVDSGKRLRIWPGLAGALWATTRGTLKVPKTDMVPRFTVSYPEPDDSILIEFERPTRFAVHPNSHSITVAVPVLPGAKDWVVITRDWAVAPVDPKAVRAALAASAAPEVAEAPPEAPAPAPAAPPARFESGVQLAGYAGGGNGVFSLPVDSMKEVRFATVIRQEQDWSCGSAAVATLLTFHYNHPMSEAEALNAMFARGNQAKIRREGFSLLDMKLYLESLGYQANGFETSLERLARVRIPAIVIVNDHGYNHFVVIKGLRHGSVLLGDPAKGNRVVSREAFEAMWENRIVFVITSRREGVAFNYSADWRFMAAPLGTALANDSLANLLMTRHGPNDF